MNCYFCGRELLYGEKKVKFVGKKNGKRKKKQLISALPVLLWQMIDGLKNN